MSYGKMAVDWEERINFDRMRRERVEKAQAAMRKYGLEAVLVLRGENTRYVAQGSGGPRIMYPGIRYVFLPKEGTPVLFEFGMYYPYIKENCPWLMVKPTVGLVRGETQRWPPGVYERQLKKFANQIETEMKDHGLVGQKLGVDTYHAPMIKALNNAGIEISLDGQNALMDARMLKTKDEVECHRMAAMIVEAGWMKVKEALKPSVTEMELKGIHAGECFRQGAEVVGCEIYSGPRGVSCNNINVSDRAIRPGDLVVLNGCALRYMGYNTCYYRTFVCGKPSQVQKDTYEKCREYLYGAIKIVKPGVTTKDLAEKWPRAKEFGFPDEDTALWTQWGHGIGLQTDEPPTVTRLWSLEHPESLKAGMVMAMETWVPTGEKSGSVRIEEMLLVTETGPEILTKWPVDELTVCDF